MVNFKKLAENEYDIDTTKINLIKLNTWEFWYGTLRELFEKFDRKEFYSENGIIYIEAEPYILRQTNSYLIPNNKGSITEFEYIKEQFDGISPIYVATAEGLVQTDENFFNTVSDNPKPVKTEQSKETQPSPKPLPAKSETSKEIKNQLEKLILLIAIAVLTYALFK